MIALTHKKLRIQYIHVKGQRMMQTCVAFVTEQRKETVADETTTRCPLFVDGEYFSYDCASFSHTIYVGRSVKKLHSRLKNFLELTL